MSALFALLVQFLVRFFPTGRDGGMLRALLSCQGITLASISVDARLPLFCILTRVERSPKKFCHVPRGTGSKRKKICKDVGNQKKKKECMHAQCHALLKKGSDATCEG
jgi:hypothetical protein